MRTHRKIPFVLSCAFLALSGVSLGVGAAFLAILNFMTVDVYYLRYAFIAVIAGIVLIVPAIVFVFLASAPKKDVGKDSPFLTEHPDLLGEEEILAAARKNPTAAIGTAKYLVLSSLSDDERKEVLPRFNEIVYAQLRSFFAADNSVLSYADGMFLCLTLKGDCKAKLQEAAKQILASFALDPTLPDAKLLLGIEGNEEAMNPQTRLEHAKKSASYDALSRLSGALLPYDEAMEIDSYRLSLDLEGALAQDRIEMTYVPLTDKNNRTVAYLRLTRLFDPSRGLIEEEELRVNADTLGIGLTLDTHLIDRSLKDLVKMDEGTKHHLDLLILPLCRQTFYRAAFLHELRKTLTEREIPLDRIALAFDGGLLVSDEAYCASFAKKAHALNMKVAIVNFSAKCPLHRIKEIAPDLVFLGDSFFSADPRLGKAMVEVLQDYARIVDPGRDLYTLVPDLYRDKEVRAEIALERLQSEEEFRR